MRLIVYSKIGPLRCFQMGVRYQSLFDIGGYAERRHTSTFRKKISDELEHYWDGSKRFIAETKVTFSLIKKSILGDNITRRERLHMSRTKSDFIKLIPFSIFIVVPFLEFLLPLFVKVFPNMLPSTFETRKNRNDRILRIERERSMVCKIVSESVWKSQIVKKQEFIEGKQIYEQCNTLYPCHIELICRFMGIRTTLLRIPLISPLLRYKLKNRLESIKRDDILIYREGGVDSLDRDEIMDAGRMRGIRTLDRDIKAIKKDLAHWIDSSIRNHLFVDLVVESIKNFSK